MTDRLETISAIVDEVLAQRPGRISTHYEECWKNHVDCLATVVRRVLDDD